MPAPTKREVEVKAAPGFKNKYRAALKANPEIAGPMREFNTLKRQDPPGRLPAAMKDHKLDGKLDGVRECHLAGDVLLLYTHENDVIKLLDVCDHNDLKGGKENATKARVKNR